MLDDRNQWRLEDCPAFEVHLPSCSTRPHCADLCREQHEMTRLLHPVFLTLVASYPGCYVCPHDLVGAVMHGGMIRLLPQAYFDLDTRRLSCNSPPHNRRSIPGPVGNCQWPAQDHLGL